MGFLTTGMRALALGAVVAGSAACGTISAHVPPSEFIASSATTEMLLSLDETSGSASATLEIASGSVRDGEVTLLTVHLAGSLDRAVVHMHSSRSNTTPGLSLDGTIGSKALVASLRTGTTATASRWRFTRATTSAFTSRVNKLRIRIRALDADAALKQLRPALSNLEREIATTTRDSAALGRDVLDLNENLKSESVDSATLRSAVADTAALAAKQPEVPGSSVCASAAKMAGDALTLSHDTEFIAGFLSGLSLDESTVTNEIRDVATIEHHVQALTAARSFWAPMKIPSAASLTALRKVAADAVAVADARGADVRSSVATDLASLYAATNNELLVTRCGHVLATPSPSVQALAA